MKKIKYPYKRLLEVSKDHKQITLLNSRYYRRDGNYYPSITYVLGVYPKGIHYDEWLKSNGHGSEHIVKKAQEEGTLLHEMCEDYLNGMEMNLLDDNLIPQYPINVWQMFLRFVEFWEIYNPKLIETEVHLFSDELKVAGTCDLVCEIDGQLWIIDFKTSNYISKTYELQISIYAKCYEECFGKKIDRMGILWLKSSKRKSKKEKMTGRNWEMIESDKTQEQNIEIFNNVKKIFDMENPQDEPEFLSFKTTAKRII